MTPDLSASRLAARSCEADVLSRAQLPTTPSREVFVATATAILHALDDPYLILVGVSAKHSRPVLVGGKLDKVDMEAGSLLRAAEVCILREALEEVGAAPTTFSLLAITADATRDVRRIQVHRLYGSIAESQVSDLDPDEFVTCRYGVPDYLFVAAVDRNAVHPSEELLELRWVDLRETPDPELGAGHSMSVRHWLRRLRSLPSFE